MGGDHSPEWQNCGFYDTPLANEHAVHSLEHGAVWITYRPDLAADQVGVLRQLAQTQTYVLVSPYPGLPGPVVASAWGHQLGLDAATDPPLAQFLRAFRVGAQAPERGGAVHRRGRHAEVRTGAPELTCLVLEADPKKIELVSQRRLAG